METFWERLKSLISEDAACRGINDLASADELRRAVEFSMSSSNIAIFTGFTIMPLIKCETDGPVGAVFLARGLLDLGKRVSIWTDDIYADVLRKGINFLSVNVPVYGVPFKWSGNFLGLFWQEGFDLLISVERPGRAIDGKYYSSRNEDISCYVSPLDELFIEAGRKNIPTIGIGDGGNEIGMGNIRGELLNRFPSKGNIFSIVKVDSLIISGVSNWGAYGLLAGLAKLSGKGNMLPDPSEEKLFLKVIVESGSVDGVTLKTAETVDGVSGDTLSKKLREIASCLEDF
ncbi:MAG: DUF4392 domain-containing protein [Synergistetes bacterium]|nr:DUF4392 domain-containing protein [Synergistota bacterium]MCX8127955.1 DUF4392 domain-containing protein [Synergistota bacterium]MDW8192004.1 DUF4392 domain-containing protein [Synergistota bacterium]